MTIDFHANAVAVVDPDNACFLVGFADEKLDTQQYLILQRAFEDDVGEQDRVLGHDTYHVEYCDQGNALYGGIERCTLFRDHIECTLSAAGSAALNGATSARIGFDLDEPEFMLLSQRLKDIFRGTGCLQAGFKP
jgi:hypothetical protein